jgi:SOS-response transcriptional repressor LexA
MGRHLREARLAANFSQTELARRADTSQAQINKLEAGERKLTKEWAERLAPHLNVTATQLLFGISAPPPVDVGPPVAVKSVPVIGRTAAGLWMEHDGLTEEIEEAIPTVPGRYAQAQAEQYAYRVAGNSMDKLRFHDGDFIICVPYWMFRNVLRDGDIVVVERRRGHLTERTCKQLVLTEAAYELWPRSTDPRYQTPIVIPIASDWHEDDETVVEITGLVIGRYATV